MMIYTGQFPENTRNLKRSASFGKTADANCLNTRSSKSMLCEKLEWEEGRYGESFTCNIQFVHCYAYGQFPFGEKVFLLVEIFKRYFSLCQGRNEYIES